MEISSSTTIQRAASREQYLSEVPVTPLGRPKKVEKVKKELFLSADCSGLQEDLGLSNSKTEVLLRDIRFGVSFTFITEKNSFAKIQQNNHQLGSFFELRKLVYRREDKDTKIAKNVELPIIVYSQLPALIETILQKQQRDRQSVWIKLSIDGGGGFLKFSLSIFGINDPCSKSIVDCRRSFLS